MNHDDTMRRIEEALDLLVETAEEGWGYQDERDELLATIRAALNAQPSPTSGESPAVSAEVAQKDAESETDRVLIEKARACLSRVCAEQRFKLTACVPARPGVDDDLVIADGLEAGMRALIRSKLPQPDAGGWGEDDDRHRANEAVRLMQQDVLARMPEGWLRREGEDADLLKPHEFTGRHRSYQDLLDEEHERAVEAWAVEATCLVEDGFYILERREIDEALRLMRRQPKETTDGN